MEATKYYGVNVQKAIDRKSGKGDYLPAGLRNANLKCTTETFTAEETVPAGSMIMVGSIAGGIVPSFAILEATQELAGQVGTVDRPDLFGCFSVDPHKAEIIMSTLPNEPLKTSGDVFVKTVNDFPAGGKISIKIFFTRD